jgi:cytochrome c oxidase subunit 1
MGWDNLNLIATIGALVIAISVLLFVINAVMSYRTGTLAGDNPWGAGTLEWATTSPPPAYNFDKIPIVRARDPLWEIVPEPPSEPTHVTGLAENTREVLITSVVDATPDHRLVFPEPTIWPFVSSVVVTAFFIGSIFTPWALVWAAIPVAFAVTAWFWPKRADIEKAMAIEKRP